VVVPSGIFVNEPLGDVNAAPSIARVVETAACNCTSAHRSGSFLPECKDVVQGMAKKRGGEAAPETSGGQASVVRIFLSSPGDVADERKIARESIEGEL